MVHVAALYYVVKYWDYNLVVFEELPGGFVHLYSAKSVDLGGSKIFLNHFVDNCDPSLKCIYVNHYLVTYVSTMFATVGTCNSDLYTP